MSGHAGPVRPGEHALLDQVRACVTDIAAYRERSAYATELPTAAPDVATAYNFTSRSLMDARVLLYRAYSVLLAVEIEAAVTP